MIIIPNFFGSIVIKSNHLHHCTLNDWFKTCAHKDLSSISLLHYSDNSTTSEKQYIKYTFIYTKVSKPFVTGVAGIYSNSNQFFFGDWAHSPEQKGKWSEELPWHRTKQHTNTSSKGPKPKKQHCNMVIWTFSHQMIFNIKRLWNFYPNTVSYITA